MGEKRERREVVTRSTAPSHDLKGVVKNAAQVNPGQATAFRLESRRVDFKIAILKRVIYTLDGSKYIE